VTSEGERIETDFLFSTIPVTQFVKTLKPAVSSPVLEAAQGLSFRSMIFCILELKGSPYTQFDAHYFPGEDTCFSRLSEPKNYSMAKNPANRTGLCFEIPCTEGDEIWDLDDENVLRLVMTDLGKTDLPNPEISDFTIRRKKNIYPVYDHNFESRLEIIEECLDSLDHTVSLGRQGLFVHDNTHHTIEMGIAAAECLSSDLKWDTSRWADFRKQFESHVVVD
jgi:protoporphyrinogen oxidase